MLEKLELVEKRFGELEEALAQGDLYADPEKAARLLKEQKELTPVVEAYRAYRRTQKDMEDAQELMHSEEGEMRELAQAEFEESKDRLEELEQQIRLLLLPKDENDDKNVIVEIRGGVGGEEAALFAHSLFRMYSMYAERKRYTVEVLSSNETELGGIKEISFEVRGAGAFSRFKFESGTHRVQRVPETESSGRIHTSAATVAVLPEAEEVEVQIDPGDLQIDTYRSGGAGGQHVNKTESAIRITHIPTGIIVACQNERSQHQNREVAMRMLKSKLMEIKEREHLDKIEDIKGEQKKIEWGSQIRSYVFMPYTLVKDHRTGCENGNIQAVMDGDLDSFINAYLKASATGNWAK